MKLARYIAWVAVAVVVAVAATMLIMQQIDEDTGSPIVAIASIGGPFTLTDQNGNTVTEADLQGHPTAIFFGYTFCPDVCPTTLFEMSTYLEQLGPDGDRLKVYFVSVDPERDTQEVLSEYLQAFDPRITGLTGTREQVDEILEEYRVFSRKVESETGGPYLMDHTATVYLLDENGNFTSTLAYQEPEDTAMKKLRNLIGGTQA